MTEPKHHLRDCVDGWTVGHGGPVDQDNRQTQCTGGIQLGAGTGAAGVFGDDPVNVVNRQQVAVIFEGEGAARNDRYGVRQGQGFGRVIDQPQQVMMLRAGSKRCQVLATDGQKNPGRRIGQGGHGGFDIGHTGPKVARNVSPWRALQGYQRSASGRAGGNSVAAHFSGKRMGGVDHMGDRCGLQVIDKARGSAKTAAALRQGLRRGRGGATGIGIDGVLTGVGQGAGHQTGLGRAPQQKYARHG